MIYRGKVEAVKKVVAAPDRSDSPKKLNILGDLAKRDNSSPKRSFGLCVQIGFVGDVLRLGGDRLHFGLSNVSKPGLGVVEAFQTLSVQRSVVL